MKEALGSRLYKRSSDNHRMILPALVIICLVHLLEYCLRVFMKSILCGARGRAWGDVRPAQCDIWWDVQYGRFSYYGRSYARLFSRLKLRFAHRLFLIRNDNSGSARWFRIHFLLAVKASDFCTSNGCLLYKLVVLMQFLSILTLITRRANYPMRHDLRTLLFLFGLLPRLHFRTVV